MKILTKEPETEEERHSLFCVANGAGGVAARSAGRVELDVVRGRPRRGDHRGRADQADAFADASGELL